MPYSCCLNEIYLLNLRLLFYLPIWLKMKFSAKTFALNKRKIGLDLGQFMFTFVRLQLLCGIVNYFKTSD